MCTCIKVSVSLPEELIDAVRDLAGAGGLSQYVTDAVDRRLLGELGDELVAEHGPVDAELVRQAKGEWPDYEGE